MKYIKIAALIIGIFILASCSTILGPEESEEELPLIPSESPFPYDTYVEGHPNLDFRVYGGFYIWKTGNLWHVRLANRRGAPFPRGPALSGGIHVFTGSIHVENGMVFDPRSLNINPQSDLRFSMNDIFFRAETRADSIEGFDFQVQPTAVEYCVNLDLRVDEVPIPEIVHLGSFMYTPDSLPLPICVNRFGR